MNQTANTVEVDSYVDIEKLTIHPIAEESPSLSANAQSILEASIRDIGITSPVTINHEYQILDGRHRYKTAKAIGLSRVPFVFCNKDPRSVVLASVLARRQLTKAGIALTVFEMHPALMEHKNKGGRPKAVKADEKTLHSVESFIKSFQDLAVEYDVHPNYFTDISKTFTEYKNAPAEKRELYENAWQKFRDNLLHHEMGPGPAYTAFVSQVGTTGKPRGNPKYLVLGENGVLSGTVPKALNTLSLGLGKWSELDLPAKAAFSQQFKTFAESLPDDLKTLLA
jgi:hypothetical protein